MAITATATAGIQCTQLDRLTAQATGRSIFANRGRVRSIASELPLKPGNRKIGKRTTRAMMGAEPGMPIYGLTLEERATCPVSCEHFRPHVEQTGKPSCYGDNMRFATRYSVNGTLLAAIESQVAKLTARGPVLVRLHVLGDFPSVAYVMFWHGLLVKYPNLRIYGYTHRDRSDPIGLTIDEYLNRYEHCAILLSGEDRTRPWNRPHAITVDSFANPLFNNQRANRPELAYVVRCPEQLTNHLGPRGSGISCADCGLCMRQYGSDIAFQAH